MADAKPEADFRLKPRITIEDCPGETFSIRFSQDGKYLAVGCGDGTIRVYIVEEKKVRANANVKMALPHIPMSHLQNPLGKHIERCLSFRFVSSSGRGSKNKNEFSDCQCQNQIQKQKTLVALPVAD